MLNTRGMKRTALFTAFVLFSQALLGVNIAHANDYTETPSGLNSFESNLAKSFVGIECKGKTGIGFAGNISLTADEKNQGTNSYIVTHIGLVDPCLLSNSNRNVNLLSGGKTYPSAIWSESALLREDYASVKTSVILPTIAFYGTIIPQVGWWVDVAYYSTGFGVLWIPAKITAVNTSTYELLLSVSDPKLANGGLVFDNTGTFLGLATTALPAVTGATTVSGAPLICKPKNQSNGGVIICGVDQNKVWVTAPVDEVAGAIFLDASDADTDASSTTCADVTAAVVASQDALDAVSALGLQVSALLDNVRQLAEVVAKIKKKV